MTHYDYAVLAFYFLFMLAVSWVFRRFVTNVSDYFRGGGQAVWWMVGGSGFMLTFSAWTFTGAASKAYIDGWPIVLIYVGNIVGFIVSALHFGPRFRQLRIVTGLQAVRLRFGRASEQIFMWMQIPFGLLQAGLWLNSLAVFFSAVFGADLTTTIVLTGSTVVVIALVGGSWGVLASDFIQVLILMPVCLTVAVLSLLKIGGLGEFVAQSPAGHLDPGQIFTKDFLWLWGFAMVLKQICSTNNLNDAGRYLCVKDGRHARRAGLFGAALFAVGIFIWFIPPMVAAIRFPDLQGMFPALQNPAEGAFIAIARDVMPMGMMGLLLSGIFAATMSSMDGGLNKNAGYFIKNFYQPVLRPGATEAHLLRVSKLVTAILGVLVVLTALKMSQLAGVSLFKWMQNLSILVATPILVPLVLGLLVRRTPPWSAWSTVLVGFISSLSLGKIFGADWAAHTFHTGPLDAASREYWTQASELLGNISVASAWFLGTAFFWKKTSPEHQAAVADFFTRLKTPVDFAREEGAGSDHRQEAVVGWLCLAYGGFVMLLAAIPNPLGGRVAFAFCGAVVAGVGGLLLAASRKKTAA
jgi:solute:Na+ symporter, SSS family